MAHHVTLALPSYLQVMMPEVHTKSEKP